MTTPPIKYDIVAEGTDSAGKPYQLHISWGNEPQWADRFRNELDGADRISLIPKSSTDGLPVVTVRLMDNRRWIVFSRVFGQTNTAKRIRLHAIGWQNTISGINVKALTWIYPTGAIEMAEEPSFTDRFFKQ